MEAVLRKMRTLENRVDSLTHKAKDVVNKHTLFIQKLNKVKETITIVLSILNSKQRNNKEKIITSISLYKQTEEYYPGNVSSILELLDGWKEG